MSKIEKLYDAIVGTQSAENIRFDDLVLLLKKLGFDERIRGSHHLFTKNGLPDLVNIQRKSADAKGYQIRQVQYIIKKHNLRIR